MNITQSLEKWGNSQGVRLPKKVVKAAQLKLNAPLEVTIMGRSIVLTPVSSTSRLEAMLSGVTPEMVGGEMNWGSDVGLERIE